MRKEVELVVSDKVEYWAGMVDVFEFPGERRWLVVAKGSGAVAVWRGGGYEVLVFGKDGMVDRIVDKRIAGRRVRA